MIASDEDAAIFRASFDGERMHPSEKGSTGLPGEKERNRLSEINERVVRAQAYMACTASLFASSCCSGGAVPFRFDHHVIEVFCVLRRSLRHGSRLVRVASDQ
jgi:hypothetical protein